MTTQTINFERMISDEVDKHDGFTFGYIGNFERWGDDRKLYIESGDPKFKDYSDAYFKGAGSEWRGSAKKIWQSEAKSLNQDAFDRAVKSIQKVMDERKLADNQDDDDSPSFRM